MVDERRAESEINLMDWMFIVMEEYKTVRAESLTAIQMQQSVLSFGVAVLGIVLATGINVWGKIILSEFIFLFLAPTISYLLIVVWMGEVERMVRAGAFLVRIEEKVNTVFDHTQKALEWESWLHTKENGKTPQIIWNYLAILSIFLSISSASIVMGIYKVYPIWCLNYVIILIIVEILILFIIIFWFRRKAIYLKRLVIQ